MGDGVTFVDGHSVRNAFSRVQHDTCSATRGVKSEDCLHVDVKAGHVEDFEHNLSHLFSVLLRVKGSFCHQDGMLFGGNAQLTVECMVPYFLHVVPVADNTVLDGRLNLENTTLLLGLFADVDFLLVKTNHDSWHLGSAHDCGEDRARSVVSSETSLAGS